MPSFHHCLKIIQCPEISSPMRGPVLSSLGYPSLPRLLPSSYTLLFSPTTSQGPRPCILQWETFGWREAVLLQYMDSTCCRKDLRQQKWCFQGCWSPREHSYFPGEPGKWWGLESGRSGIGSWHCISRALCNLEQVPIPWTSISLSLQWGFYLPCKTVVIVSKRILQSF